MNNEKQYLTCAETAKLVRAALKESFPGVKFSVRSSVYSGGASIRVGYTDGPTSDEVNAVAKTFEGAYFDGMIDYKGCVYHEINGKSVRMGANFVFVNRSFSDPVIQSAIDEVYEKLEGNFKDENTPKPTVEDFKMGRTWGLKISGGFGSNAVQREIHQTLAAKSLYNKRKKSAVLAQVSIVGNDGYSKAYGSGF